MARVILLANLKGGCGKTTFAHHLAVRAAELGASVLVIDTDQQGDLYRRLCNQQHRDEERLAFCWDKRTESEVVYSPGEWFEDGKHKLIIVDTKPAAELPTGPRDPDVIIIPIDGLDAALNANETVGASPESAKVLLVRNGTNEGGKRMAHAFAELGGYEGVEACPTVVPRGGAIKRTSITCKAAWKDAYKGRDSAALYEACEWLLGNA